MTQCRGRDVSQIAQNPIWGISNVPFFCCRRQRVRDRGWSGVEGYSLVSHAQDWHVMCLQALRLARVRVSK